MDFVFRFLANWLFDFPMPKFLNQFPDQDDSEQVGLNNHSNSCWNRSRSGNQFTISRPVENLRLVKSNRLNERLGTDGKQSVAQRHRGHGGQTGKAFDRLPGLLLRFDPGCNVFGLPNRELSPGYNQLVLRTNEGRDVER